VLEALWALGLLVVLGAVTATALFPWQDLLETGQAIMLWAGAVGIPLELMYFGLLAWALGRSRTPPVGWYWRSFLYHDELTRFQKRLILPWFFAGALSFAAIAFGILLVLLAFVAAVRQA
jgi:hypothetical protein